MSTQTQAKPRPLPGTFAIWRTHTRSDRMGGGWNHTMLVKCLVKRYTAKKVVILCRHRDGDVREVRTKPETVQDPKVTNPNIAIPSNFWPEWMSDPIYRSQCTEAPQ